MKTAQPAALRFGFWPFAGVGSEGDNFENVYYFNYNIVCEFI